jgi:hypothetical protein
MNNLVPLLAHGNLGFWDEVVFITLAAIFIGFMLFSWFRSRQLNEELDQQKPTPSSLTPHREGERFELE